MAAIGRVPRSLDGHDFPEIDSHHDMIVSSVLLPVSIQNILQSDLVQAPRIQNQRHKIVWSEEGIALYQAEVATKLADIRLKWLNPLSKTSLSILLKMTNEILHKAALSSNTSIDLNSKRKNKSKKKPKLVKSSEILLKKAQEKVATNSTIFSQNILREAKKRHRSIIRAAKCKEDMVEIKKFHSILSSCPSAAFTAIRSSKSSNSVQIPFLKVDHKRYVGDRVVDGFYDSISKLKTLDHNKLANSPHHDSLMEDYTNIKYLCQNKFDLPSISIEDSSSILKRIKPGVIDFFSITARHFIHAGTAGLVHFNLLLNAFIANVNNSSIEELNSVYALLLYKGHSKDKSLDSSYRTISTCPLLAKGLDMYIRDLEIEKWNQVQAETQYQGEGSSHELASLLITEAVQHSKFVTKKPIFLLFLDAKSAFDRVFIPYLVRNLYLTGMNSHSVLYMEKRLSNRITFCEFDKVVVGPVYDEQGLEQGGVPSSDCYKIYNNEMLETAQKSNLGVELGGSLVLSAVGQADDTSLLSNELQNLKHILYLTLEFCQKFNVELSPSKTKLLAIMPPKHDNFIPFNPIFINDSQIDFTDQAEHVGVIRSAAGNMPNILQRLSSFKKALGSIISCGLAKGHGSNPAASLRILSIYGTPVLMSGLASLVHSSKEIACLDQQYKRTVQNLLKLSTNSPPSLVCFISGSLPATAILHMKQFVLFSMICRLPEDPLNKHARQVLLTSSTSQNSWFVQVRNLFLQYQLPHPLLLLETPPPKVAFKNLCKSKIVDFWETKLRNEASFLPSFLPCFQPHFSSLSTPHRLLTTAGHKAYEIAKARIQLLFLSSQYRCGRLTRHWSSTNPEGYCTFPSCFERELVESNEHILLYCPAYITSRQKMVSLAMKLANPDSRFLATSFLFSPSSKTIMQFLLDCSALPEVISSAQQHGEEIYNDLFYLTRNWCFSIHRERSKRLGLWNFR